MKLPVPMHGNEPAIDQGIINSWYLSWNPDDDRFYVCRGNEGLAAATFKDLRNARQYARGRE